MSRLGKNIRVRDKSTNPGFAEGKEVNVMETQTMKIKVRFYQTLHISHGFV